VVKPLLAKSALAFANLFVQSMGYLPLGAVELVLEHLYLSFLDSFALKPSHNSFVILLAGLIQEEILLPNGRLALGVQGV
jgi:hypothetical protein